MEREEHRVPGEYLNRLGRKRALKHVLILEPFLAARAHLSTEALYDLVNAKGREVSFSTLRRTRRLFSEGYGTVGDSIPVYTDLNSMNAIGEVGKKLEVATVPE